MVQINLKKWGSHLQAARTAGVSLAQYARKHGLSRHTLYAALRAERELKGLPAPRRGRRAKRSAVEPAAFVPVALGRAGARLAVRLPNGVALECHDLEGAQLRAFIASLAALPCSA